MPCRAAEGEREEGKGPVIVVSGPPGGGKSTYARRLAADLGLRYFTTGSIFRALARELGVSLVELSRMAESDPRIDLEIDSRTLREAARGGVVVDSHLAGWVLAHVADVLVYVKAPLPERAARLASRDGVDEWSGLWDSLERETSQWRRFKSFYGIDSSDVSHYHLVVDTSLLGVEEAYAVIRSFVVSVLRNKGFHCD